MIEISPKEYEIHTGWNDARMYCFALNIGGKTGWRLPTIDELDGIYMCVNNFAPVWYWASDSGDTGVWFKAFSTGWTDQIVIDSDWHTRVGICAVRPVRDLKDD